MQCVDLGGRRIIKKAAWRMARGRGGLCFFQAEDGIRDVERSRGLGDVYKRQIKFNNKTNKYDPVSYTHLTLPTICSV